MGLSERNANWLVLIFSKRRKLMISEYFSLSGKLMIGDKDFSQEKKSPTLSLELLSAAYHIGGVSPIFDPAKWKDLMSIVPYVGCMKNILINNSPYDPLSGTYYGVESPCSGKVCGVV